MLAVTLFPVGVMQLFESVSKGYWAARSPEFLADRSVAILEWLRLPGDLLIIIGGTLPLIWLCWKGVRGLREKEATDRPRGQLYEYVEPPAQSEEKVTEPV